MEAKEAIATVLMDRLSDLKRIGEADVGFILRDLSDRFGFAIVPKQIPREAEFWQRMESASGTIRQRLADLSAPVPSTKGMGPKDRAERLHAELLRRIELAKEGLEESTNLQHAAERWHGAFLTDQR